jgi:uncharacterized protein
MANPQGTPVWYEIIADDAGVAEAFYGHVLGWRFQRAGAVPDRDYRIAETDGAGVAGVMRAEGPDMPRGWFVYFGVEDVDGATDAASGAGASVHVPPTDIPGVGRFSCLADPQGTLFYLMRGAGTQESQAFRGSQSATPGHAVWNELSAADPDAAIAFYGSVLGLRQEGAMPMGELGEYRFIHAGPECIGAVMGEVPNGRPGWQVYFLVVDIDAGLERVEKAGGRKVQGPDPIPGGAFSLVAEDDQGARFGLVGRRN